MRIRIWVAAITIPVKPMSMPDDSSRRRIAVAVSDTFDVAARLDWQSYDPFDLLLSPYLRSVSISVVASRARSRSDWSTKGTGLRRVLSVPKHEPKTFAEFLRASRHARRLR
jgi:hypothetical protein